MVPRNPLKPKSVQFNCPREWDYLGSCCTTWYSVSIAISSDLQYSSFLLPGWGKSGWFEGLSRYAKGCTVPLKGRRELSALHKPSKQHSGLLFHLTSGEWGTDWHQTPLQVLSKAVLKSWVDFWAQQELDEGWYGQWGSLVCGPGAGSSQVGMHSHCWSLHLPNNNHQQCPPHSSAMFPRQIGKHSSFCRVCLRDRQCCMDPVRSVLIFWDYLGKPAS